MSYLTKQKAGKILVGDTFQIARQAALAKESHANVIDATVGALFDDDQQFYEYKTVTRMIKRLAVAKHYAYAPTSGGDAFKKHISDWVFGPYATMITNEFHHDVVATPGASGALYNTFMNYLDAHDTLIMPDIYWTNYLVMLGNINAKHLTYPLFKEGAFHFDAFVDATKKVLEHHQKIVCLFNDPAHNPTGYSLSLDEWTRIYDYLNGLVTEGAEVIVLYDLAYLDYEGETHLESRRLFEALKAIETDILVILAFSGSKSFSLYGLRLGAQIALSRNKQHIKAFKNAAVYSARGTWSCPPSTGPLMLGQLFSDDLQTKKFAKELDRARVMLRARAEVFLGEAKIAGLPTYPYRGGFFITIPVEDPDQAFDRLAGIHIYTIPVDQGIRIAISSIPMSLITGMARRIKNALT